METQNRLAELNGDLAKEKLYPEGEIRADKKLDEIVGKSAALRWLLHQDGNRKGASGARAP
jgi:hypothetical protein